MSKNWKRKNGPVITRKFIDEEHMRLFDKGKITLEEASYVVPPVPILKQLLQEDVREYLFKTGLPYAYPNNFHPEALRFVVVNLDDGEAKLHKYLYTTQLMLAVTNERRELYVTSAEVA